MLGLLFEDFLDLQNLVNPDLQLFFEEVRLELEDVLQVEIVRLVDGGQEVVRVEKLLHIQKGPGELVFVRRKSHHVQFRRKQRRDLHFEAGVEGLEKVLVREVI